METLTPIKQTLIDQSTKAYLSLLIQDRASISSIKQALHTRVRHWSKSGALFDKNAKIELVSWLTKEFNLQRIEEPPVFFQFWDLV